MIVTKEFRSQDATPDETACPRTGNAVLVVENTRAISSLLKSRIESISDVRCMVAGNYEAARLVLERDAGQFFVAVLDINLPDAPDGEILDLAQQFGIPVVVLTEGVDDKTREALFARNIADYIEKTSLGGVYSAVALVERMRANREHAVLVVDDSAAQRAYICSLLHNRGYQTIEAVDGEEGLAVLRGRMDIRLVISDYEMPKMDGLEMIRHMRMIRSTEDLAIIGISAVKGKGILPRFLKGGANDFLAKPFELEEFYCRIDQNLDMIRFIREAWDAARRDFLTQLNNRRYFFEHAEKIHAMARQQGYRVSLAMIDADHFKKINDTYGHQVGDEALVAIARTLQAVSGGSGVVGRIGGEEFACIRVLSEGKDGSQCLERLRAAVEAIDLRAPDGSRVPLTVSIGVTQELGETLDAMLASADAAVYQAKQRGRNCVVMS